MEWGIFTANLLCLGITTNCLFEYTLCLSVIHWFHRTVLSLPVCLGVCVCHHSSLHSSQWAVRLGVLGYSVPCQKNTHTHTHTKVHPPGIQGVKTRITPPTHSQPDSHLSCWLKGLPQWSASPTYFVVPLPLRDVLDLYWHFFYMCRATTSPDPLPPIFLQCSPISLSLSVSSRSLSLSIDHDQQQSAHQP